MFSFLKKQSCPHKGEGGRKVQVGWVLDTEQAQFIWSAPERLRAQGSQTRSAKSVTYCPAVLDHEARMFEVTCPVDLHLRLQMPDNPAEEPRLINAAGDRSTVRSKTLNQLLNVVSRKEWRHPDRPILQFVTPYIFVADETAYMTQLPPFCSYESMSSWPGTLIGGRFPVHIWPRHMMWAFEWHDTGRDLILRRGDPFFYVRFETDDPTRPVQMVEADFTPALREYVRGLTGVTNYVNRTFSLFHVAKDRRPEKLLVPKER